jgi:hypothetical protein
MSQADSEFLTKKAKKLAEKKFRQKEEREMLKQ